MKSRLTSGLAAIAIAAAVSSGAPRAVAAGFAIAQNVERGTIEIRLEQLATGLDRPVYLTHAGDGSNRLFVVEKDGRILVFRNGQQLATSFLDIVDRVEDGGNEQGLLSVAFHPDYESNGRFFVYYTAPEGSGTIVIAEYHVSASDEDVASRTERRILTIPHPDFTNHNGGLLKFGPDGKLYAGIGDGGFGNDPNNNGQNRASLLGKIIRIDVDSGNPYQIPTDNPFVGQSGARGEIYAYGFRNPWRYSFDRETGELWVGDVGQNQYEEVDVVEKGGNYGWKIAEGFHCRPPTSGCDMTGLEPPLFEYSHSGSNGVASGCSITGGYVYRGSAIPSLVGSYLFADYCGGSGTLYTLAPGETRATALPTSAPSEPVTSFGEDEAGELYVVTDSIFGGRGTVFAVTTLPTEGFTVTSVAPSSAPRKTVLDVTIEGSGFEQGAHVSFGKKIKVRATTVVSPTRIDVTIKVKKATRGARDVVVTNPGGATATGAGLFTVE